MKKLIVAAATVVAVLTTADVALAQAQKAPAVAQKSTASPAALAAAKEILVLKNARAVYEGAVVSTIQNVKNSLMQSNLNFQRDIEEISLKLAGDLKGRESQIADAMAQIYANDFTEQELKDLLTFYKSPLGKKSIEQEPKSIEASLNYMRNWGEDLALEVNELFRQELKKRGKEL
jgi:hypothetical protein